MLEGFNAETAAVTPSVLRALELLLMLAATTAWVERDAGLKRELGQVMTAAANPATVDARLRLLSDGPPVDTMKTSSRFHPLIEETAKRISSYNASGE